MASPQDGEYSFEELFQRFCRSVGVGAQRPTVEPCLACGWGNIMDSRAPKCPHFCTTCSSTERRLPLLCKAHPEIARPQR